MKTIRNILTTAVITFAFVWCSGQSDSKTLTIDPAINTTSYNTAIGVRAGTTSDLTIKQHLGNRSAIEGIFGVWNHGLSATLLYEIYTPAFDVAGLNWYYGAGGHAAFNTGYVIYSNARERFIRKEGSVALGVDGIVGLEYKIPQIPFAVSADLKPFVEVGSTGFVWMNLDPGIGIKFTF